MGTAQSVLQDIKMSWRLPGDVAPLAFSEHAVTRFRERCRPGLDDDQVRAQLLHMLAAARVVKDPPPWLPNPNRYTVGYLVCADVWLPLRLNGGELRAMTALVRRDFAKPDKRPAWERAKREARTRRRTKASAARLRQQRDLPPRDGEWEQDS